MENMPHELRLNILKYGRERLGLSDEELVEEIKRYDPSFDYNKWINDITLKEQFLNRMKNHPFLNLLKYIRENDIDIVIQNGMIKIGTGNKGHLDPIVQAIEEVGYEVSKVNPKENTIYSPDIEKIRYDLAAITMLIPHPETYDEVVNSYYNNLEDAVSKYGLGDLVKVSTILDTPDTLSEYLRYTIDRLKRETMIKKYKAYSLYWKLDKLQWQFFSSIYGAPETSMELYLYDKSIDTKPIIMELVELYGPGNIIGPDHNGKIKITGTYVPELEEMEKFYHPYSVQDMVDFI